MRPGYAARRFSASQQASRNVTSPAVQRTSRRRYPLGQCRVRSRPIVLKKSGFVADHKWRGSGRARSGKTRSTANTSEEPVETCGRGDEPATMRWAPSPHGFLLFGHSIENRLFKTIDPLLPLTEPTVRHGARAAEASRRICTAPMMGAKRNRPARATPAASWKPKCVRLRRFAPDQSR